MQNNNYYFSYIATSSMNSHVRLASPEAVAFNRLLIKHKVLELMIAILERQTPRFIYDWGRNQIFDSHNGSYLTIEDLAVPSQENPILKNRVVIVPNSTQQSLLFEEILEAFRSEELFDIDGVVVDLESCGGHLQIDDEWAKDGFMMPNYVNGLNTALKIYSARSNYRPFLLGSRYQQ